MKLLKNPEIRKEIIVSLAVTAVLSIAGFFLNLFCGIGILVCGLCLTGVHYYHLWSRYKRISELSDTIDSILHGQEDLMITDSDEGELAILKSEIHKMTVRLKEQSDLLIREKTNLTDAIADIFHQIRTPLTSLNINVEMLRERDLPYGKRVEIARTLSSQLGRIQWLVEALLKLSRIDAGVVTFNKEETDLAELINNAAEPFLIPAEVKGIELITAAPQGRVLADRKWTAEALGNIIKNAIEHTPEGGRVSVSADDNALFSEVIISDTGEGFSKEDIPHLFERFYKGANSSETSIGIGLALSRSIIAAQNGTVSAANSSGGGAVFSIRFYKSVI